MAEPHVSLNPSELPPAARRLREPLEAQLSSALQAAVEEVRENYAGEGTDEVAQELLTATRDGLHPDIAAAFMPDQAQLDQVAEVIVETTPPEDRAT
jgi:hypothetical protein